MKPSRPLSVSKKPFVPDKPNHDKLMRLANRLNDIGFENEYPDVYLEFMDVIKQAKVRMNFNRKNGNESFTSFSDFFEDEEDEDKLEYPTKYEDR